MPFFGYLSQVILRRITAENYTSGLALAKPAAGRSPYQSSNNSCKNQAERRTDSCCGDWRGKEIGWRALIFERVLTGLMDHAARHFLANEDCIPAVIALNHQDALPAL